MSRILQVVFLLCVFLFPSPTTTTEDELYDLQIAYFPQNVSCAHWGTALAGTEFAAKLHWIAEVLERHAPYELGYAFLYSMLVVVPLIPFLCFILPSHEKLIQEKERIQRLIQEETEHEEEQKDHSSPQVAASLPVTYTRRLVRSRSESSLYRKSSYASLADTCSPGNGALRITEDRPLTDESSKGPGEEGVAAEQCPELSRVSSVDSFTLLKELGTRMCVEPSLGKGCVVAASGVLISYGVYRFLTK